MRDPGLSEAIKAAGGVGALAQRIGISQPSISNWNRVPAERVVAIEAATGIPRAVLRPDLYGDAAQGPQAADETDLARAHEYALLSVLLARAPSRDFLGRLASLRGDASPLGVVHAGLAEAASGADAGRVEREFFNLFIGIGRGELMPYGSYYLTGFLHERPLARLREDLLKLGIERAETNAEPEDHIAILCEIMAGIASRRFAVPEGAERDMFVKHLAPWAPRFFADLERAEEADVYRRIGTLGRVFMDIETDAFALPA